MSDDRIRELFGFTPTNDFRLFWEFAGQTGLDRLADVANVSLVGPFDVLAGRFDNEKARFDASLHWRYFGDTPEFVTVLVGGGDGLHWGYAVDRPDCVPLGIAGYFAHDDVSLFQAPSSLFDLVAEQLTAMIEQTREDEEIDPDLADDELIDECEGLLESMGEFRSKRNVPQLETEELELVSDSNPPSPFPFPEPEEFGKIPQLIEQGIGQLKSDGYSEERARLKIGRLLWHWHYDGNPLIEEAAFGLLDSVYAAQKAEFLRHVLREHRTHRHRKSLDVFE